MNYPAPNQFPPGRFPLPPNGSPRKRSRTTFWIVTATLAVVLATTAGFFVFQWYMSHSVHSSYPTYPTSIKYRDADLSSCEQIDGRDNELWSNSWQLHGTPAGSARYGWNMQCWFHLGSDKEDNDAVVSSIDAKFSWYVEDDTGPQAQVDFMTRTKVEGNSEPTTGFTLGEKSNWVTNPNSSACELVFLDHNAVFQITYDPTLGNRHIAPQVCRDRLRTIAQGIYAAVQPR